MSDDEKREAQWRWLLTEADARTRAYLALREASKTKTDERMAAARAYWEAVNAVLWFMVRVKAQGKTDLVAFPAGVLADLANASEDLANGHRPDVVEDVGGKGSRSWRSERHDVAYAVHYIEAAKRGEIKDRSPVKTVCLNFGVTSKTAQDWQRRRAELLVGVPVRNWSADRLTARMEEGGRRYRRGLGMTAEAWPARR